MIPASNKAIFEISEQGEAVVETLMKSNQFSTLSCLQFQYIIYKMSLKNLHPIENYSSIPILPNFNIFTTRLGQIQPRLGKIKKNSTKKQENQDKCYQKSKIRKEAFFSTIYNILEKVNFVSTSLFMKISRNLIFQQSFLTFVIIRLETLSKHKMMVAAKYAAKGERQKVTKLRTNKNVVP